MASIVFDPTGIDSNSSAIGVNDGDIDSNSSELVLNDSSISDNAAAASDAAVAASSNSSQIVVVDAIADSASSDAVSAASDASDASTAASDAVSDVDVIEADDKYAKSVYSDPATGSFAIFKIDITSDSHIFISHSDTAVA